MANSCQWSNPSPTLFWRTLWKIKLPWKIKKLCGRFFYNSIPSSTNLVARKCCVDAGCQICGFIPEITSHILLDYRWSQPIWAKCAFLVNIRMENFSDVADWLFYYCINLDLHQFQFVSVEIWFIWSNHKRVSHGADCWDVGTTFMRITSFDKQFTNMLSPYHSICFQTHESGKLLLQAWLK